MFLLGLLVVCWLGVSVLTLAAVILSSRLSHQERELDWSTGEALDDNMAALPGADQPSL